MTNVIETFEKKQIAKLTNKKRIPAFRPGDTLKVIVKITEGDKTRLQAFEGVCIARKNNLVNSNFTVRKISHGEGVEKGCCWRRISQIIRWHIDCLNRSN